MNGQKISGYYWDEVKRKYFKIENKPTERTSKYSAENVRKQEQKRAGEQVAFERAKRTRRERVTNKREKSLAHILATRELGVQRSAHILHAQMPSACISGVKLKPARAYRIPEATNIRFFDHDPDSGRVYAVVGDNRVVRNVVSDCPASGVNIHARRYGSTNAHSFNDWEMVMHGTSSISSICYLRTTSTLAFTTYGSERPPTIYICQPEIDGPCIGQTFQLKGTHTIWGSAARPASFSPSQGFVNSNNQASISTEHLAVAYGTQLILFKCLPNGTWTTTYVKPFFEKEILATEWISYTTVAVGCRDGKIHLFDTRADGAGHVLSHPYPISKLRRADDETRLVCSGLEDSLCLYDIRFSKRTNNFTPLGHPKQHLHEHLQFPGRGRYTKKEQRSKGLFEPWSQPVLTFEHQNTDDLDLDIDIHPQLGLLAAAQDPASAAIIRVSNLWTGKTVKELYAPGSGKASTETRTNGRIRCLRFMGRDTEDDGPNIWATWKNEIVRYAWS